MKCKQSSLLVCVRVCLCRRGTVLWHFVHDKSIRCCDEALFFRLFSEWVRSVCALSWCDSIRYALYCPFFSLHHHVSIIYPACIIHYYLWCDRVRVHLVCRRAIFISLECHRAVWSAFANPVDDHVVSESNARIECEPLRVFFARLFHGKSHFVIDIYNSVAGENRMFREINVYARNVASINSQSQKSPIMEIPLNIRFGQWRKCKD